jgi:hypothetical protein
MKLRIVRIPGWTPHKRPGIMLESINELGFHEKMTFVLQVHKWVTTDKGFEEIWEDVPVFFEKELHSGEAPPCAG